MTIGKKDIHVGMVSWQFWPLPEGGSERQCGKIVAELVRHRIKCSVLTAYLNKKVNRIDNQNDCYSIIRLGRMACFEPFFSTWFSFLRKYSCPAGELETLKFWLSIPFVYVARLSFMLSLRKFLLKNNGKIDVLHVHEAHWIAGAVAWAARGLEIPVVCKEATYPSVSRLGYDTPLRNRLTKLRKDLQYIALTEPVRESLLANGIAPEKITLLPNGVEIPGRKATVLGSKSVVYIGNFTQGVRQKAFDILFESWVQVHSRRPELVLTVLGGGDNTYWQRFIESKGCGGSVEFKGTVADVGAYLEKARVFVLPSRIEGLSNALLEAMSWGVPVAVSDIPPNRGLVQHQVNGLVFPVNDSTALAEAILELSMNDELAVRLAKRGRQTIVEGYSIEKTASALIRLYRVMIKGQD